MKLCFRKKRGLCTLLLILCCGSGWSLNQRHGGSTRQTDRFCLREDFHQLWKLPMTNVCCKYEHVDKGETEDRTERADSPSQATSEMDVRVVGNDTKADVGEGQSGEEVVTQLESSLTVGKNHGTHPDDTTRNTSENATGVEGPPEPRQREHLDAVVNEALVDGGHQQNETENATSSILNDSIRQEAMPSFVEWKRIRLEKGMQDPTQAHPKEPEHRDGAVKPPERKRGRRNYASIECGAKLVAANAGAEGASKVLLEAQDEYMLNPCNSLEKGGMWFIVELCESLHPTHIELANFELYSSTGKEFVVYMSDHYQSREWTEIGRSEMAHLKSVQSFPLNAPGFGKVIKVEFLSIYENNQYYCPLSLVRVFGSTMVDDYEEKVEAEDIQNTQDTPVEEPVVEPTPASVSVTVNENVVSRAKKVVFNIINSMSKVVSGTKTIDGNCSDCAANESSGDLLSLGQQFDNCFELTNLSGLEGHLWPSMKCRFAEVANVQRSCRPLPVAPSIRIEPSPLRLLSNLSPPVSVSAASTTTAAPSITMTAEMISPTTVAEAEKKEELKTQTKVVPMKSASATKNETPQAQPSATQKAEPEVEAPPVEQASKQNAKIPPVVHVNAANQPGQPTVAPNQAPKENLFKRFENRIKALELHMNLGATYLEELSRNYRNQMEEMQAAFNKTVAALNKEAKKGLERDQNQQQALAVLQEKLTAVTESLRKLEIESDSLWWRLLLAYLGLLAMSLAIIIVLSRRICQRVAGTMIKPEDIERQVLEILERERLKNLPLREETELTNHVEIDTKPEAKQETDTTNKAEVSISESRPIKTEPIQVKSEPSEVKSEPSEVKEETPYEHCSTEKQLEPEPFQGVAQKRKRRRKKHPRGDCTEVDEPIVSGRHLSTPEISSEGSRLSDFTLMNEPALFSINDDTPFQDCRKCALSCCTHALLRH